ncbi:MAG: outer membrane beta-barrel protein [Bacteroidetes bacterium]|nr:outer membrane beta-barrel protein [Bacteroidota bacterium]
MKRERHPVDDFFKEALQGHQVKPSGEGKQRFLDEATTILMKRRRGRNRWIFLFAGIVIISLTALLVILPNTEDHELSKPATDTEDLSLESTAPESTMLTSSTSPSGPALPDDSPSLVSQPSSSSSKPKAQLLPALSSQQPFDDKTNTQPATLITPDTSSAKVDLFVPVITAPQDDTLTLNIPESAKKRMPKDRATKKWQFSTSLYYTPEWMFNTLEGEKYVNNLGVEGAFQFDRYSIRTGVGLSITKGTNELLVEYNDYLGSYSRLDSMTFQWDEKHYHLIPTYYSSNKDVWDSLMKLDYPKITKRYTYLQIPLILGYDIIRQNWITFGIRAGPILSILLESKQISGEYDPGKNRVIRINQITPDRIQTNWQVVGGVNASFRISPRISLEVEPNIRYYFNSVYEKSDATKKPWSAGFRTAFTIWL